MTESSDSEGVVRTDVVVIGGGIAGSTTRVGLSDNGLNTTVFESRSILGGRARSWGDPETGDPVQIGPHIFLSEYPNMMNLLEELVFFNPCPYVSSYLWFNRKLTDLPFWARAYWPNDLNCDFYDLSNINSGWEHPNSVITNNIIYSHNRGAD